MLTPSGGGLILYQAYGNLYAMTGRKAHLLEDKQILSIGVFDEILGSKGAIPSMKATDAKKAIQDMSEHLKNSIMERLLGVEEDNIEQQLQDSTKGKMETLRIKSEEKTMKESLRKFMVVFAKRHEENSNLIKEIRASTDVAIRNQGASIKAMEIQIGQMSKTTIETDTNPIRRIRPSRYAILGPQNNKLFFVPSQATIPFPSHLYDDGCNEKEGSYGLKDLDAYSIRTTLLNDVLPPKEKDPRSFTLPSIINHLCFNKALANLGASVSVMPFSTYTNLGLGKLAPTKLIVELADRTVKHPKGIAEDVLVRIDKFVFPIDFIVLDMPEDIKTPLIIGRPLLSTAHAKIDVFKRKISVRVGNDKVKLKSDKPTSNIIKRLKRYQVDDLEPTIEEGEVVDEPMMHIVKTSFYNLIMKDKVEFKWKNVVRAFMNVPIFVGNFSIITDFAVIENMDSYRDEGMGDIAARKPFCKEACSKARRFNGMITIYKGNDSVTYQMVRSHLRFKHLTNAQCNKMRPLLKVSAHDELKGISHPYQKLKGFYNEVLNLGPENINNEKVEEWLTRRHVSIHETE
ncbi:hypothetical protein Tco_0304704 [Tanacetum coccineum]